MSVSFKWKKTFRRTWGEKGEKNLKLAGFYLKILIMLSLVMAQLDRTLKAS